MSLHVSKTAVLDDHRPRSHGPVSGYHTPNSWTLLGRDLNGHSPVTESSMDAYSNSHDNDTHSPNGDMNGYNRQEPPGNPSREHWLNTNGSTYERPCYRG